MSEINPNISLHLGMTLGLPALLFLTIGTILVLANESKFVKVHGYLAVTSWILTLINVITLIAITPDVWSLFSAGLHSAHIILGGLGLITGFFSMLFGMAAERKPAKLTGYITLICWWGAFLTGFQLL